MGWFSFINYTIYPSKGNLAHHTLAEFHPQLLGQKRHELLGCRGRSEPVPGVVNPGSRVSMNGYVAFEGGVEATGEVADTIRQAQTSSSDVFVCLLVSLFVLIMLVQGYGYDDG